MCDIPRVLCHCQCPTSHECWRLQRRIDKVKPTCKSMPVVFSASESLWVGLWVGHKLCKGWPQLCNFSAEMDYWVSLSATSLGAVDPAGFKAATVALADTARDQEDQREVLGATCVPILAQSLKHFASHENVVKEVLRALANLCAECDANRQLLVAAQVTKTLVQISGQTIEPATQFILGVLILNWTMDYAPAQEVVARHGLARIICDWTRKYPEQYLPSAGYVLDNLCGQGMSSFE